jgi:hypothetical protein
MQYLQYVHGITAILDISISALSRTSSSSFVTGLKGLYVLRLSSIWATVDIPLNTQVAPGSDAA